MVRSLLGFSHILRTRSGCKLLALAAVTLTVLPGPGCKNNPEPPSEPPHPVPPPAAPSASPAERSPRLAGALARLEDESKLHETTDVPSPSGDLRHDIEAFTTLDDCTRTRRIADPLLADVVESMGYDTFVRDACRMLEALKAKDPKPCRPIALSALRARCETSVAVLAAKPELCPVTETAGRSVGRDPTCLARASRDPRFCAAALAADRPACTALVLGDANACARDAACRRQVARWRTLIEKPGELRPFAARAQVEVHGLGSTPEPSTPVFDLDDIARQGALVTRLGGGRTKITVGATPAAPTHIAGEHAEPGLLLELVVSAADLTRGEHSLGPAQVTLDLRAPGIREQPLTTVANATLTRCSVGTEVKSPVDLALKATLLDAPQRYAVTIDVETFVRDVIGTQ
jgi:hypothetical protein